MGKYFSEVPKRLGASLRQAATNVQVGHPAVVNHTLNLHPKTRSNIILLNFV